MTRKQYERIHHILHTVRPTDGKGCAWYGMGPQYRTSEKYKICVRLSGITNIARTDRYGITWGE